MTRIDNHFDEILTRRRPMLTMRRLLAMEAALSAMLAGEEGEGDWPPEVTADDLDAAHSWVCQQITERPKRRALAKLRKAARARDREDAAKQFAADKARYFPEPPEHLA